MKRSGFHINYRAKRRVILGLSIVVLGLLYFFSNSSYLIRSISTVLFFLAFYLIDHLFSLHFRVRHYLFVFFIAITSFLLSPLYFISPHYDKVLHVVLPALFASLSHHLVSRLKLEKKWRLVFVFALTVAMIGLFEIGEYNLDQVFDLKLQGVYRRDVSGTEKLSVIQDPIDDTMIDLSLGVLGAAAYIIYADVKYRKKARRKNG